MRRNISPASFDPKNSRADLVERMDENHVLLSTPEIGDEVLADHAGARPETVSRRLLGEIGLVRGQVGRDPSACDYGRLSVNL